MENALAGVPLIDPLLLAYVLDYLAIPDKLVLSTLSKPMRGLMENHFRMMITQSGLVPIPKKTSIHQMNFHFGRCLTHLRPPKNNEQVGEVKVKEKGRRKEEEHKPRRKMTQDEDKQPAAVKSIITQPFKFEIVTYFQVGPIYSACLTQQHQAFIFRTNQLLQDNVKELRWQVEKDVKAVQCKGDKIVLLYQDGHLEEWQTEKKAAEIVQLKDRMRWTTHAGVDKFKASYNYVLCQLEKPFLERDYLMDTVFEYGMEVEESQAKDYHMVVYNAISHNHNLVRVPGAQKVLSFSIGHKEALIVDQNNQCLVVQFEDIHELTKQLTARPHPQLIGHKLSKVFCGHNFYFALQTKSRNVLEWGVDEVASWLRQIGFGDFTRIARAEKVDGQRLCNMERSYMYNALGITKPNMQHKLELCINELKEGKGDEEYLWAWGKNEYGQLGVGHAMYVQQPLKLKLDFIAPGDRVDRIFCGWYHTFIRTRRGHIFQTTFTTQRKKKKQEEKQVVLSDQQDHEDTPTRGRKHKKKEKQHHRLQSKKDKEKNQRKFEQQQRWIEADGKAFFVSSYKQHTFLIQCAWWKGGQKAVRFKTSKAVMDRILWDGSLDKADFKIGIVDMKMGLIEVSPLQLQMYDYREKDIKYVKRRGAVVWDRQNKIDHF